VESEEERTECHEQTWHSLTVQVIYRLVCKLDGWMAMTVLLALIFAFLIAFIVVRLSWFSYESACPEELALVNVSAEKKWHEKPLFLYHAHLALTGWKIPINVRMKPKLP
jgi:hypothetical protein